MKSSIIVNLLAGLSIVLVLSSCEEVIDIDLNSSDPVIAAEGLIEKDSVAWLKLSYTSDYFTPAESEMVDDAFVTITDDNGISEILEHQGNGLYRGNSIVGITGLGYTLKFSNDEYDISASSLLFDPVEIYSVTFEESTLNLPGQEDEIYYNPVINMSYLEGINDYSMIKFWVNGEENRDRYYLVDAAFYAQNNAIEYIAFQLQLSPNDVLYLKVFSIDGPAYEYYYQLNEIGGDGRMGSSSTPYNPESNFGSEVMGYFAAWSFVEHSTIVFY